METRRIGISLGNIGALHDGLGEFALQIGTRVAAQAPAWRAQHGIAIDFHLREKLFGLFGPDVGYLPVSRWQRLHHVQPQPFALWHSLHQLNKNLPPNMEPGGPRVVTVHDLNYVYGRNAFSTWRHGRRTRALMRRTDVVVAISRHTAADVQRELGWTGPLEVISSPTASRACILALSSVLNPARSCPARSGAATSTSTCAGVWLNRFSLMAY